MGKITVKHYLSKRAKPNIIDGKECYPTYVRVIFNRQNTNYKSEIITEILLDDITFGADERVRTEIEYEIQLINYIIEYGTNNLKDKFSINRMYDYVALFNYPIRSLFYDIMISEKEIAKHVALYISQNTSLTKQTVSSLLGYNLILGKSELMEIIDLNILPTTLVHKLQYYWHLYDYQELKFPESAKYGANKTFCFYVWNCKTGKRDFLDFSKNKGILSNEVIEDITNEFQNKIEDRIKFEMDFNVTRSQRNT